MDRKHQIVEVVVDDRERNSTIADILAETENISVHVKRLPIGDYLINDRLLFERKTLTDFAASIVDGRLFNQAIRLAELKTKSIYILEGTGKDLARINVRRESIQGALITISVVLGIPVLRARNPKEAAQLMVYTAKQVGFIVKGAIQRYGRRPVGKRKRQIFILQGLPGVGAERAERLLDTFGSVEAVLGASVNQLQSVKGIGRQIAGQIKWSVQERVRGYGDIKAPYPKTDL